MNNKSETIKIIASLAIIDENDINDEDALSNIGIDSLRSVELIVALEDSLNITFDDSDLDPERLNTVKDILNLIEKYSNK